MSAMRFIANRASRYSPGEEEPPFEGCVWTDLMRVDVRHCSHPHDLPLFKMSTREEAEGWWSSKGTNHRVLENGNIARDMGAEGQWVWAATSLDDIAKLIEAEGEIVINAPANDLMLHRVTIYDDYLE